MIFSTALASTAAETVYAKYSALEFEIAIADLKSYADTGREPELIQHYGALFSNEQLQQLRQALSQELDFPAPVLARFLSTPSGYRLLESLTKVVQSRSTEVNNVLALRTAIILAAASDDKLTLVSLLESFPSQGVELNLNTGIQIFQALQSSLRQHQQQIAAIKQTAIPQQSSAPSIRPIQIKGPYSWKKQSYQLKDERPIRLQTSNKPRSFPLDLYLPDDNTNNPKPLIILSHGLGSGLGAFQYLAEHFASHGYVVAVPEHPGSSINYWRSLLKSQANQISNPQEFIDRPLDIQYVIDYLTLKNSQDPMVKGQINLAQIGVFGHSYGGYTALAVAGADINFEQLKHICEQDIIRSFNPSLLLQCQASSLPRQLPSLKDERVKALFVTNPIMSAVLGEKGLAPINIPITVMAGGADTIAPLIPEQLNPFKALRQSDKFLVVVEQLDHFATIGELSPEEELFTQTAGASASINRKSRQTVKVLGLGFFNRRLKAAESPSTSFLTTVQSLNHNQFPIYGLGTLPESFAANSLQTSH